MIMIRTSITEQLAMRNDIPMVLHVVLEASVHDDVKYCICECHLKLADKRSDWKSAYVTTQWPWILKAFNRCSYNQLGVGVVEANNIWVWFLKLNNGREYTCEECSISQAGIS